MRIRRYAARLLSSSTTATNPASPPAQPAAAWLHAPDDDCCAFCDIIHTSPQESPDAGKRKGHIASRVPESDVNTGELDGLSQGLPASEAKKCKINHGLPINEADAGLGVARGCSVVSEADVKLEDARGPTLLTKADANNAANAEPFVANDATIDQELKCGGSLTTDSAKPNVTGGNSLVNESTSELEVLKVAPHPNEVAFDPEVRERVSPERRASALPKGPSVMNESEEETGVLRADSLVNEASTEPELTEVISLTSKTVTDAEVTNTLPEVTRTGSLSSDGAVGPEVTREACLVQTAQVPEDSGRASCSADDDHASNEARDPSSDTIDDVQVENAGETLAIGMQPSCFDASYGDASTRNSPVETKDLSVEGVAHFTPSVSCVLDVVARSIGRSGRTDVICYARRKGKKKPDLLEVKTENIELDDGVICDQIEEGPCDRFTSRAGSADVKLADIKRELMDNSTARTVKKMKTNKFECDIDYCLMTFKTKTELAVHKKNICTVKSCSRRFRSHKYLRRHQSVHNDYMPYRCPWEGCNMAFKWSWDRAEHFQIHAGKKPYRCTTPGCSKIYKFVSDFTRHRRRCKPQR